MVNFFGSTSPENTSPNTPTNAQEYMQEDKKAYEEAKSAEWVFMANRIAQLEQEIKEKDDLLYYASTEKADFEGQIKKNQDNIQWKDKLLEAKNDIISEQRDLLSDLQNKMNQKIKELTNLNDKIITLESKNSDLNTSLQKAQSDLKDFQRSLKNKTAELEKARATILGQDEKIAKMYELQNIMTSKLDSDAEKNIQAKDKQIYDLQIKISQKEEELAGSQRELSLLQAMINKRDVTIESLLNDLETANRKFADLKQAVNDYGR